MRQIPTYDHKEALFINQREKFIEASLAMYKATSLKDLPDLCTRPPRPLEPTIITDFRHLTSDECAAIRDQYESESAVAYFIVLNPTASPRSSHPLLDICLQLAEFIDLKNPIMHPLEKHPEAIRRFGPPDGTVKIYDLAGPGGALTSRSYSLHQDGLGNCGDVQAAALYADSVPLFGGYNYFVNICRIALELAKTDYEAFSSLFLPDAITIVRTSGRFRIKVTSPVLFLGPKGYPQASFRHSDSEYKVFWREDSDALLRAREFMMFHTQPFAYGSYFVHLAAPGHACINQNQLSVHGRTRFYEGGLTNQRRVLSRKWFGSSAEFTGFKLAPGVRILSEYADLFPELFGWEQLQGGWSYDPDTGKNIRSGFDPNDFDF